MLTYKTEAIILAGRDWGEADKLLTLFSREYGKISAIAYGARRPQSRLAGSVQLFTNVELTMVQGKTVDTIKQCDIKQTFQMLREDLKLMAYSLFMAELVAEICPERQPDTEVFDLLNDVFNLMLSRNARLVVLAGAWQLLALAGFKPDLNKCCACGEYITFPAAYNSELGGLVCSNCETHQVGKFDFKAVELIDLLLKLNLNKPEHFTVSSSSLVQAERMLINNLLFHLEKPLKSLDFIKHVSALP